MSTTSSSMTMARRRLESFWTSCVVGSFPRLEGRNPKMLRHPSGTVSLARGFGPGFPLVLFACDCLVWVASGDARRCEDSEGPACAGHTRLDAGHCVSAGEGDSICYRWSGPSSVQRCRDRSRPPRNPMGPKPPTLQPSGAGAAHSGTLWDTSRPPHNPLGPEPPKFELIFIKTQFNLICVYGRVQI